ncbi:MAG TPA: threonine-phosphate decarboxylase [Methanocella sp.]|nr:threonine-phosphate decarboxylase [Methanocella sp.]
MFIREELKELTYCTHGGRLREIAKRKGLDEKELLDYSVNVNPYMAIDPSGILMEAMSRITEYPDNGYEEFRGSAARFCGAHKDNIVPGNGSTEIIRLFAEMAIEKGDIITVPSPTFGEYEQQCRLFGARIRHVKYSDILDGKYEYLDGSKAAFICNPNNPDGTLIGRGQVLDIADHCKSKRIMVIVDEAFIDLADPEQSVAGEVEAFDNLLVLRSLTKCFAIPGFRLGFGVVGKADAGRLNIARLTWNIDSVAADIGAYYMDTAGPLLNDSREYVRRERERMYMEIGRIPGLRPFKASANYFLLEAGGLGLNSGEFAEKMLDQKILVRDCSSFKMPGDSYVRLAVRTHNENNRLLKALKTVAGSS